MKIALVELSRSHEECLYSQLLFLEPYIVDLWIHPSLLPATEAYAHKVNNRFYIEEPKQPIKRWRKALTLAKNLSAYDKVIFNTASSSKLLRNTSLLLIAYSVEALGILHNRKKLDKSFTQKIINFKIKKYWLLSEHLLRDKPPKGIATSFFYPIYFPRHSMMVSKPIREIWIGIIGSLDFERRDYFTLLDDLQLGKYQLNENIKFMVLGKSNLNSDLGQKFCKALETSGLKKHFVFFDYFLSNQEFYAYITALDAILPLIKNEPNYLQHKISGCVNLSIGFKKPMFIASHCKDISGMRGTSVVYTPTTLVNKLNQLPQDPSEFNFNQDSWSFEQQKQRYLDFLFQ